MAPLLASGCIGGELLLTIALAAGLMATGLTGCNGESSEPAGDSCDTSSGAPAEILWEKEIGDASNLPYLRDIQAVPGGVVLLHSPGDNTGYHLVRLSDEGDVTADVLVPPLNSGGSWGWEGLHINNNDELILTATDSGSFRVVWIDTTSLAVEASRVFRVPRLARGLVQRGDEFWSFGKETTPDPDYEDDVLQIDVVTRTTHDTFRLSLDPTLALDTSNAVPLDNGKALACARVVDQNIPSSDAEWLLLELDIENDTIERLPPIEGGVMGCRRLLRVGSHVMISWFDGMGYVMGLLDAIDGSLVAGPAALDCLPIRDLGPMGNGFLSLAGGGVVSMNTALEQSEPYLLPRAAYSRISVHGDRVFIGSNTIDCPVWDHDISVTRIAPPPIPGASSP